MARKLRQAKATPSIVAESRVPIRCQTLERDCDVWIEEWPTMNMETSRGYHSVVETVVGGLSVLE